MNITHSVLPNGRKPTSQITYHQTVSLRHVEALATFVTLLFWHKLNASAQLYGAAPSRMSPVIFTTHTLQTQVQN